MQHETQSYGFYCVTYANRMLPHPSAHENFFQKKYTHAGSLVNTILPACYIYPFPLPNLQSSAQNPFRAEDFCSIIIETRYGKLPKAHRKPTEVPQIPYGAPETCSTPIPILRKESFSTILATSKYYDAA